MGNNCQVPTPQKYVNEILDCVGYKHNLYDKSVLENSCGEGNFLIEIVRRYITTSLIEGYSEDQIIYGLENYITGYDIDGICVKKCIENLDNLVQKYNLSGIHWNIHQQDYLKCEMKPYDYIIGNPPYITYQDLTEEQRSFVKGKYETCKKGRFDYCYAFVEAGLRDLATNGKLAYLIPYSIIRNKHAEKVRTLIKRYLNKIIDYKGIQIFPNRITSSIAIVCDKEHRNSIKYYNKNNNIQKQISKNILIGKWIFEKSPMGLHRFGNYFKVTNSIATLYNNAFIFELLDEDDSFYYFKNGQVEKKIVFDAVSTKSEKKYQNSKKRDKIIFPYKKHDGKILSYSEDELKKTFPKCYSYLKVHKEKLLSRKSSQGIQWFEYGRSQAINNIFVDKLIMSVVITNSVNIYDVGKESVPYAGVFITALHAEIMGLDKAKKILQSDLFLEYVKKCGTPTTISSYRITVKDIEDYYF